MWIFKINLVRYEKDNIKQGVPNSDKNFHSLRCDYCPVKNMGVRGKV